MRAIFEKFLSKEERDKDLTSDAEPKRMTIRRMSLPPSILNAQNNKPDRRTAQQEFTVPSLWFSKKPRPKKKPKDWASLWQSFQSSVVKRLKQMTQEDTEENKAILKQLRNVVSPEQQHNTPIDQQIYFLTSFHDLLTAFHALPCFAESDNWKRFKEKATRRMMSYLYKWTRNGGLEAALTQSTERNGVTLSTIVSNRLSALLRELFQQTNQNDWLKEKTRWKALLKTLAKNHVVRKTITGSDVLYRLLSWDWPTMLSDQKIELEYNTLPLLLRRVVPEADQEAIINQIPPFPFEMLYRWSLRWPGPLRAYSEAEVTEMKQTLYEQWLLWGGDESIGAALQRTSVGKRSLEKTVHTIAQQMIQHEEGLDNASLEKFLGISRWGHLPAVGVRLIAQLRRCLITLYKTSEEVPEYFREDVSRVLLTFEQRLRKFYEQLVTEFLDTTEAASSSRNQPPRLALSNRQLLHWILPRLRRIAQEEVRSFRRVIEEKQLPDDGVLQGFDQFDELVDELEEIQEALSTHQRDCLRYLESQYVATRGAATFKLHEKAPAKLVWKLARSVFAVLLRSGETFYRLAKLFKESQEFIELALTQLEILEDLQEIVDWPKEKLEALIKKCKGTSHASKTGYQRMGSYFLPGETDRVLVLAYRIVEAYEEALVRLAPSSRVIFLNYVMELVLTLLKEGVISAGVVECTNDGFCDAVLFWLANVHVLVESQEGDGISSRRYREKTLELTDGSKVKASVLLCKAGLLCQDANGRVFRSIQPGQDPGRYGYRISLPHEVVALNTFINEGYLSGMERPPIQEGYAPQKFYYGDDLRQYDGIFQRIPRSEVTKGEIMEERLEKMDQIIKGQGEIITQQTAKIEKLEKIIESHQKVVIPIIGELAEKIGLSKEKREQLVTIVNTEKKEKQHIHSTFSSQLKREGTMSSSKAGLFSQKTNTQQREEKADIAFLPKIMRYDKQ